jgi:hypothetical protein
MTWLRRAPREVYRVYGEEEFFAETTPHTEPANPTPDGNAEHQLQRLVGATALLVTVGVVGGMIAIASISSSAGRRRSGTRVSAAGGSPLPAGERVARMDASAGMPVAPGRRVDRDSSAPPAGERKRPAGPRRSAPAASPHRLRPRVVVAQIVSAPDSAPVVQVASAGAPVSVTDSMTGTSVASRQPVQAEFGFER